MEKAVKSFVMIHGERPVEGFTARPRIIRRWDKRCGDINQCTKEKANGTTRHAMDHDRGLGLMAGEQGWAQAKVTDSGLGEGGTAGQHLSESLVRGDGCRQIREQLLADPELVHGR